MSRQNNSNKIRHFQEGEFCVLVTHDARAASMPASIVDMVLNSLKKALPGDPVVKRLDADAFRRRDEQQVRITSFSGEKSQPFSLLTGSVPGISDADLIQFVTGFREHWTKAPGVQAVTPNWYAGGAPGPIGTGGPGAKPVAVPAKIDPDQIVPGTGRRYYEIELPPDLERLRKAAQAEAAAMDESGEGRNKVTVCILDTAPDGKTIESAHQRLKGKHHLLDRLLAIPPRSHDPRLTITYGVDLPPDAPATYIAGHNYLMPDHGLFVAGIINSIAPNARLRLIEVLNKHGVGTAESIARGLVEALNELSRNPSTPLVVNCSLMLDIPRPNFVPDDLQTLFRKNLDTPDFNRDMALTIEFICNQLFGKDASLVGAAGNEGNANQHPPARYPAAFVSTVGVGAADRKGSDKDTYSNTSDDPTRTGFVTLGGHTDPKAQDEADPDCGMLGVYIGPLPAVPKPIPGPWRDGWARWAGTSFATPIISGVLALLRQQAASPGHTMALQALTKLCPKRVAQTNEIILPATQ